MGVAAPSRKPLVALCRWRKGSLPNQARSRRNRVDSGGGRARSHLRQRAPGGQIAQPVLRVGRFETLSKSDKSLRTTCLLIGGDTGGPLLDLTGKVVGIHSKIGIFLAHNMHVPVEEYEAEWEQLLRGEVIGKTDHADLGLEWAADKLVVVTVTANGPADKAGMRAGDVIFEVNGKAVKDRDTLLSTMEHYRAGVEVTIHVRRGVDELTLKAKLTYKNEADRAAFQNGMGGALSGRRTGFPAIVQHDTVIRPADCGGPIVDLDGRVLGVNIARAGRAETWALPASVIEPVLKDLIAGKYAPPK